MDEVRRGIQGAVSCGRAVKRPEFKRDALAVLGLTGHPKAGLLWNHAKTEFIGGAFTDVWYEMEDLVKLLEV